MKHSLLLATMILSGLFTTDLSAQTKNTLNNDASPIAQRLISGMAQNTKTLDAACLKYRTLRNNVASKSDSTEFRFLEVTSHGGDLDKQLGDDIYDVDSLVVKGQINDDDFTTLWLSTFYGRVSVINMEHANVKRGVIPKKAFWKADHVNANEGLIYIINLRRIIMPEGIKRIEEDAFSYALKLEEINIPSTLQYVDGDAFYECVNLRTNPLAFPEGFAGISGKAFYNCKALTGKVELPSTIKYIDSEAFYRSRISSINLPEGLTSIGDRAFSSSRLKEVDIPNSCQELGEGICELSQELEKIHLPEGLKRIPPRMANTCLKLREVYIPSSVKTIGEEAFQGCQSIKKLELPKGLETIEDGALWSLESLEEIVFPATLKYLGARSCMFWTNIKRIYCMAPEPPKCEPSTLDGGYSPFGSFDSYSDETPRDIPVYVPVGSADKYRMVIGWNYFDNFVETDNIPTAIQGVVAEPSKANGGIYDLAGRKVEKPQKGNVYVVNGKKVMIGR